MSPMAGYLVINSCIRVMGFAEADPSGYIWQNHLYQSRTSGQDYLDQPAVSTMPTLKTPLLVFGFEISSNWGLCFYFDLF